MTNNPTIDGVCKTCLGSGKEYDGAAHTCTACNGIGGAPVVERHKTETVAYHVTDEFGQKKVLLPGAYGIKRHKERGAVMRELIDRSYVAGLQDQIKHLTDGWHTDDSGNVKYWPEEVAALQSTIARLEARVAELESGKGEPIYEQRYGGGWISVGREEYERCLADPEEASSLRIVFTTPPAPVAAVTDERVAFESYYRDRIMGNRAGVRFLRSSGGSYLDREVCEMWSGWQARACLDATAALSKSP